MANLGSNDTDVKGDDFSLPAGAQLDEESGDLVIRDSGGSVVFRRDEAAGEWVSDSLNVGDNTTTRADRADLSENNPHSLRNREQGGLLAPTSHPWADNPVLTPSDLESALGLSNVSTIGDPFVRPVNGMLHLLCEVAYDPGSGKEQDIFHAYSPFGIDWTVTETILSGGGSLNWSYPWFQKIDRTWTLILSNTENGIPIYTFDNIDKTGVSGLTEQETVLTGEGAVIDPTPVYVESQNRWYIFAGPVSGDFNLYYAGEGRDLIGRSWTTHPSNPLASGDQTLEGPAGRAIIKNQHVELPVENQTDTRVRVFRVTNLTPSEFNWTEAPNSPILHGDESGYQAKTWKEQGQHHIDLTAGDWGGPPLIITDGKDQNNEWSLGVYQFGEADSMVAALAQGSSSAYTIANSGETVPFDFPRFDTALGADASQNAIVAPASGWYQIYGDIDYESPSDGVILIAQIQINGSTPRNGRRDTTTGSASDTNVDIQRTYWLDKGDVVTLYGEHSDSEDLTLDDDGTTLEVIRMSTT